MASLNNGKVIPWHVQINPCNQCNFHCSFCSCENRDKTASMPYTEMAEMVKLFKELGMKCVTITGGGEPILYPHLSKLLKLLHTLDVEVGLVTNGSLLHKLSSADLNRIKWCRISCSDELPRQVNIDRWFKSVLSAVAKDSCVDWAFSYVLSTRPQYGLIKKVIEFANEHDFTHVRIVSDLFNVNTVPQMNAIRGGLIDLSVDVSRVIFQGRKSFTCGSNPCFISLIKPVVSADGKLFPCCGSQYALEVPGKDYEKSMCMGSWRDLPDLIEQQKFFKGSVCKRCYYNEYQCIGDLVKPLEHVRFV